MPRYTMTCPNGHIYTFGQIAKLKTPVLPFCMSCLTLWQTTEVTDG